MYRGIIFDLDGTLLDTSEGVLSSVRHTIKTMGYRELPEETLLTFIGPPVKRSLMEHYGLDDAEADRATAVFRDQYKNVDLLKARPYDGILPLLDRLKSRGFLIGVATLKREDYALTILEHFGIAERCDLICGSDFASKMQKVDVLHKCLDGLKLSPKEALLIGIPPPMQAERRQPALISWLSPSALAPKQKKSGRNATPPCLRQSACPRSQSFSEQHIYNSI